MARKIRKPRPDVLKGALKPLAEEQEGTELGLCEDLKPSSTVVRTSTEEKTILDLAEELILARQKEDIPVGTTGSSTVVSFTEFDNQKKKLIGDIGTLQNAIRVLLEGPLAKIPKEFQTPQPVRQARMYNPKDGKWELKDNPVYDEQCKLIKYGQELAACEWALKDLEDFRYEKAGKTALEIFKSGTATPKRDIKQAKDWQNIWSQKFANKGNRELDTDNAPVKMFKNLNIIMGHSPKLEKVGANEVIILTSGTVVHTPYGMFKVEDEITTKGTGNTLASVLDSKYANTKLEVNRYIVTETSKGQTLRYLIEEAL